VDDILSIESSTNPPTPEFQRYITALQSQLSEQEFQAAWGAGAP